MTKEQIAERIIPYNWQNNTQCPKDNINTFVSKLTIIISKK